MRTFDTLKKHAKMRAEERFDFGINRSTYQDACRCLAEQKKIGACFPSRFLRKCSDNRSMWLVSISDKEVVAIYDKKRKAIATLMPKEWKIPQGPQNEDAARTAGNESNNQEQ